jgi:hypothetical protein
MDGASFRSQCDDFVAFSSRLMPIFAINHALSDEISLSTWWSNVKPQAPSILIESLEACVRIGTTARGPEQDRRQAERRRSAGVSA